MRRYEYRADLLQDGRYPHDHAGTVLANNIPQALLFIAERHNRDGITAHVRAIWEVTT